ncbi:MAG: IS982 family transposase [Patescibacteria group bacterium]|nr:IS982 family transposase [Patescibacteria group bacterium]
MKNIFDKFKKSTGRKLAININDILTISLFKNKHGIPTKKSVYEMLGLEYKCSYKTLVVNMNRFAQLAAIILMLIMRMNRQNNPHPIKHIDSTDIPVCLFKNANKHKTMKLLSAFSKNSKGTYFGLKLHLITDLRQSMLAIKFTPANIDDRKPVPDMCEGINGFIIADAGYVSDKLAKEIYEEGKRIFISKPKKNMKKLMTKFEELLYKTRFKIEYNFRDLKLFKGLLTSMPRSVDGYLANYIYSLLAYQIA